MIIEQLASDGQTFRRFKHRQRLTSQPFCIHFLQKSAHLYNRNLRTTPCIGCSGIKETTALLVQVPADALCRMTPKCFTDTDTVTLRSSAAGSSAFCRRCACSADSRWNDSGRSETQTHILISSVWNAKRYKNLPSSCITHPAKVDPSAVADRRIRRRKFVRRKSAGKITARRISRRILLAVNTP